MAILVGVAGWDYPDWKGPVYPLHTGRGFDRLVHLARFVDTVEINSTFYRPVSDRVAAGWARRTQTLAGFRFTAKAHRSWTHEPDSDPGEVVPPTLLGLAPLRDAGRLGALLLQFPQSFRFEPEAKERIERLVERLEDWPAVVEVRHASWASDEPAEWLGRLGVGWCAVDQPRVGGSTVGFLPRVTAPVAYARLHGRNAANWLRPGVGRDLRYDYLYSDEQLSELVDPIRRMAETSESLYVVQNNHFRGQALVNALQMKRLLTHRRPAAPQELVAAYPGLASHVTVESDRLF